MLLAASLSIKKLILLLQYAITMIYSPFEKLLHDLLDATLNVHVIPTVISFGKIYEFACNIAMSHGRKEDVLDKRRSDIWSNGTHRRCSLPSAHNKRCPVP